MSFKRRKRIASTNAHELWEAVGPSRARVVLKVARAGDIEREAHLLQKAEGDGVVRIVAVADARTLVLEKLRGQTLADVLATRRLHTRELRALALRLAEVLARVHACGVVHGDVTPDNIILGEGRNAFSRATLIDFDTARLASGDFGPRVSVAFAAPERFSHPCAADPCADVFSLGVVLATCRMQQSPFADSTRDGAMLRVLVLDPPRPVGADAAEARALRAMLAKEPSLRPTDVRAAVRAMFETPRVTRDAQRDFCVGVARAEDAAVPYAALAPALRSALALDADISFEDARAAIRRVIPASSAQLVDVAVALIVPDAQPPSNLAPLFFEPELLRTQKHRGAFAITSALVKRGAVISTRGHVDRATREIIDALGGASSVAPLSRSLPPPSRTIRDRARARALVHALSIFDEDLFAATTGKNAHDAIEALVVEGSVVRDDDALRSAGDAPRLAYEALSIDERKHLHARIAAVIAALRPEAHVARAEHLALAGSTLRAVHHFDLAAGAALEASDLASMTTWLSKAERVIVDAPSSPATRIIRGLLDLRHAQLERWRGDPLAASTYARAALARLSAGSSEWCEALGERATAAGKLGDRAEVLAVAAGLRVVPATEQAAFAWDRACARTTVQLFFHGEPRRATALTRLFLKRTVREDGSPDARRRGLSSGGLTTRAIFFGRLDEYLERLRAGVAQFEALGDERSVCMYSASVGYAYAQLGDFARAERSLRRVVARAETAKLPMLVTLANHNLGFVLAHRPHALEEAIRIESDAIDVFRSQADMRYLAGSLAYRARMYVVNDDVEKALSDARESVAIAERVAGVATLALGALAEAYLAAEKPVDALDAATRAKAAADNASAGESSLALAWLSSARSLVALDRHEEAAREAHDAARLIRSRARRIRSVSWRESFLRKAPDHAETFALERKLGVIKIGR